MSYRKLQRGISSHSPGNSELKPSITGREKEVCLVKKYLATALWQTPLILEAMTGELLSNCIQFLSERERLGQSVILKQVTWHDRLNTDLYYLFVSHIAQSF